MQKHPMKVYWRTAAEFNADTTLVLLIRVFYFTDQNGGPKFFFFHFKWKWLMSRNPEERSQQS